MTKYLKILIWKIRGLFNITPDSINHKFHLNNKEEIIKHYFESHTISKLHIGCQSQILSGWLNTDLKPKSRSIALLDATKPFYFKENTFDYIFSEHMIEHIKYEDSVFMINECYRVLKKGGKIRISTPDLKFLINLYHPDKSKLELDYIHYSERFLPDGCPVNATMVINNFFHDWGHQFIHDKESLIWLLKNAGFGEIQEKRPGESSDINLQNLEHHGNEIGQEFNLLESIVIEAVKI